MNNEDHVRKMIRRESIGVGILIAFVLSILIIFMIFCFYQGNEERLVQKRSIECLIYSRLDTKCGPGEVKYVSKTNRCSCFSPRGKEISFPYAMPEHERE